MKHHIIELTVPRQDDKNYCVYREIYRLNCSYCRRGLLVSSSLTRCRLIRSIVKSIRRGLIAEGQCWLGAYRSKENSYGWQYFFQIAIPEEESLEKIEAVMSMIILAIPKAHVHISPEPQEISLSYYTNAGLLPPYVFRRIR